jgi:hypothetical protein
VANFVKRLNKGTNGRYRGKIPLICFNCDGIGHFDNKCPHKKKRNDEGYSKGRQTYKGKRTTKKVFKKNFCTKEDISSSDEDEVSDSETGRVLFMAVEDSGKEDSEEEYEEAYEEEIEEAEVDFREELMSAIEVIRREKKKSKKLQEELDKKRDTQELEQMITKLKVQIEEDKRIEEALKEQLEGKDRIIGNLEANIVTLRKDIQKKNHIPTVYQEPQTKIICKSYTPGKLTYQLPPLGPANFFSFHLSGLGFWILLILKIPLEPHCNDIVLQMRETVPSLLKDKLPPFY